MIEMQVALCREHGVPFEPTSLRSPGGRITDARGTPPFHGLRVAPKEGFSGLYIWAEQEPSDSDDFYQPLCARHLADLCQHALRVLGPPAGWRFLTDGEYSDVWFDATLLA